MTEDRELLQVIFDLVRITTSGGRIIKGYTSVLYVARADNP